MCKIDIIIDNIHYTLWKTTKRAIVEKYNYAGAVVIPESVTYQGETYKVEEIRHDAFSGCKDLFIISIPSSIDSIGGEAFDGCDVQLYIESIEAWMNTYIDFYIDYGDEMDKDPKHNLPFVANALYIEGESVESLVIPDSIQEINEWQFIGWDFIKSFKIPDSVKSIGQGAFQECSGITEINIPASVENIAWDTFYKCEGLRSVAIDGSVKKIGAYAFGGLKNLCDFYCFAEEVPQTSEKAFAETDISQYGTLYVPSGAIDKYRNTVPWCYFKNIADI